MQFISHNSKPMLVLVPVPSLGRRGRSGRGFRRFNKE
jgi:hypothetical protein